MSDIIKKKQFGWIGESKIPDDKSPDIKQQDKTGSNKWVAGTTVIYYWNDGTRLRLTDKSMLPYGARILDTFESVDKVPQSIINEVITHNKNTRDIVRDTVQLTTYKENYKNKVTDKIKVGKIQGSIVSKSEVKDATHKDGTPNLFTPSVIDPQAHAVVKFFNGGKYWVDGYTRPPNAEYWWDGVKTAFSSALPGPDIYQGPQWRIVNGVVVYGTYIYESIEVLDAQSWGDPDGGNIYELETPGIYSLEGNNSGSSGTFADGRNRYAVVGYGSYESFVEGGYEDTFDNVIAEATHNTFNPQLGENYVVNPAIDNEGVYCASQIGAKINTNEWTSLIQRDPQYGEYLFTKPSMVVIQNGQWVYAEGHPSAGDPYVFPVFDSGDKQYAPQYFDNSRHFFGSYYPMGRVVHFSSKRDDILHINFKDVWHLYYDFNTSDETKFHMSKVKITDLAYDENNSSGMVIPAGTTPTVEVILIPKKWKYITWWYGLYGDDSNLTPKWITTEWYGSPPEAWGYSRFDPGVSIDSLRYDNVFRELMYQCPTQELSIAHHRYSHIMTPSGLTYGPVYSDSWIEDMINTSLSVHLKMQCDQSGQVPRVANGSVMFPTPGYSAWSCPITAGQLAAIIRVIHQNGAIDHRYVYAKATGDDNVLLMMQAYANFWSKTANGGAMQWVTPENWLTGATATYNYNVAHSITPNPVIGSEVIDSDISSGYQALYSYISSTLYPYRI